MRNMMCLKTRCDISRIFCDSDNFSFFFTILSFTISRDFSWCTQQLLFYGISMFSCSSRTLVFGLCRQHWRSKYIFILWLAFNDSSITFVVLLLLCYYNGVRKAKPSAARDLEVVMTIVILQVSSTTTIVFFKDTFSITLTPQSIWSRLYIFQLRRIFCC